MRMFGADQNPYLFSIWEFQKTGESNIGSLVEGSYYSGSILGASDSWNPPAHLHGMAINLLCQYKPCDQ